MDNLSTPTLQEVHLCDRRPVHHGPWLPDTLGPPICPSTGGQKNLSRADEDRFQQTHKNFSQKKLAVTTGKKLVDLRDAAFKLFEVVQKPSGGCLPSPSNCYQPNAWVLVVQLGCET